MEKVKTFNTFIEGLCKLSEFDIIIRKDDNEVEMYHQLHKYMTKEGREFVRQHTFGFIITTEVTIDFDGMKVSYYLVKEPSHLKEVGSEFYPIEEISEMDTEEMVLLARDGLYHTVQSYRA